MEYEELFIVNRHELQIFKEEELIKMFAEFMNGSTQARKEIITHNIRLVFNEVKKKFDNVEYDKADLVSIGIVGLIKAVDSYASTKGCFIPYAIKCIDNEILMFLRTLKKIKNVDSLEKIIATKNNENSLKIEDTLSDDTDIEKEYIDKEVKENLKLLIDDLPYREREIIKLRFGFYDDHIYKLNEIAKIMNISTRFTSKIIMKVLNELKQSLKNKGIVEKRIEKKINHI